VWRRRSTYRAPDCVPGGELLAEDLTNRRIAESLFITEKTVSVHVTHILESSM
jgi:hypothetical protein